MSWLVRAERERTNTYTLNWSSGGKVSMLLPFPFLETLNCFLYSSPNSFRVVVKYKPRSVLTFRNSLPHFKNGARKPIAFP